MPNLLPDAGYLRTCLDYAPNTGELRWKRRPRDHFDTSRDWKRWNTKYAGAIAGRTHPVRYQSLTLDRIAYFAHRVIWKLMTESDPIVDIDHKDRNGLNNCWANLRLSSRVEAVWNRGRMPKKSALPPGVYPAGKKWRARIRINGVQTHIATCLTVEAAAAEYETAARKLHGDFYRIK